MPREWLIPLESRRSSSRDQVNFLYREDNVYVSDNHRVAAWCWLQYWQAGQEAALFHIDRHSDTLLSGLEERLAMLPPMHTLSLNEYLAATTQEHGTSTALIHWSNYLSLFLAQYPERISTLYWTQLPPTGDPPRFARMADTPPHEVPLHLSAMAANGDKAVVNLDLDFFLWRRQRNDYYAIYSDAYIQHLCESIAELQAAGGLLCLTIALSPECCGGWANAERLLGQVGEGLRMDLALG